MPVRRTKRLRHGNRACTKRDVLLNLLFRFVQVSARRRSFSPSQIVLYRSDRGRRDLVSSDDELSLTSQ